MESAAIRHASMRRRARGLIALCILGLGLFIVGAHSFESFCSTTLRLLGKL